MTPQELKNSILQLAMQGKLVEQRPEEGTGEEFFQQIQASRGNLIDIGKNKKTKHSSEISTDEILFDIPENWMWVRLNELVEISTGKKDANFGNVDGKYDFFTCSNTPIKSEYYTYDGEYLIMPGNGANIGLVIYYNGKFEAYQRTYILRNFSNLNLLYLKYHLESNWKKYNADKMYGSAIPFIKLGNLQKYLVALPPLAEQKRIVAKIEEVLPYVDRYEQAWSKLEDFNKRFPDDMQKSILQMAIQGKLVEQRSEEGTGEDLYQQIQDEKRELIKSGKIKKDKPLPDITEDEKPFDIPDNWKWVRLNDAVLMIADIDHKMPTTVSNDGYPYVSPVDFTATDIDYDHAKLIGKDDFLHLSKKCKPERGDIIFPRYGTIGVVRKVETDRDFLVSYSCCTIKNARHVMDSNYVFYTLQSGIIKQEITRYINKTTQPNIGLGSIKMFVFPLPPLAEQKRIVAKLEEILPLCEKLK